MSNNETFYQSYTRFFLVSIKYWFSRLKHLRPIRRRVQQEEGQVQLMSLSQAGMAEWKKACPHCTDGREFEPNLLSIHSAGFAPEVNLRITRVRKLAKRDPPWVWNPGQTSHNANKWVSVTLRKGLLSSKNVNKNQKMWQQFFNVFCMWDLLRIHNQRI